MLSVPSGIDGSTNKLTIRLPSQSKSSDSSSTATQQQRNAFIEKKRAVAALVRSYLDKNDNSLFKLLTEKPEKKNRRSKSHADGLKWDTNFKQLSAQEKKLVFNRVMSMNLLNLFQKLSILDRFDLHGTSPVAKEQRFMRYVDAHRLHTLEDTLFKRSQAMTHRMRHKSSLRLHQYKQRRRIKATDLNHVVQRLIRFTVDQRGGGGSATATTATNGQRSDSGKTPKRRKDSASIKDETNESEAKPATTTFTPIKSTTHIKHVAFCSGEFSHLVIACTENRILIWNLLTLRLKSSLKLSVNRIVVDLHTSLVSAFTTANELFVFLPNTPLPLYQRANLPKILGAAWIPRRHPKPHSLTVDWQAITELYLLSEDQVSMQYKLIARSHILHFISSLFVCF